MMRFSFVLAFFTLFLFSCKKEKSVDANSIINKSIQVSGGEFLNTSTIEFDFRDKYYKAIRENGKFQYERSFKDSIGEIKDVLKNEGFQRFINDTLFVVSDGKEASYSASVNSVHYFSVLPYGLNDAAVNKQYIDTVELNGNAYHKIKITFNQDGGGEDFEDVFVYWVNAETFKVDYLAYSYNEGHGKGYRFREAFNERYVNGIRFVDYNNYKPKRNEVLVSELDVLFEKDQLELLSKIELKNIQIN